MLVRIADRQTIAAEVRAELARQSVSQAEVGRWLELTKQAVNRRLLAEQPFRAEEIAILAAQLGVPAEQFLAVPERVA